MAAPKYLRWLFLIIYQTGKTTAIRRVAFRETGVSRHPLRAPDHHSTVVLRKLREPLVRHSSCREMLVSRTAINKQTNKFIEKEKKHLNKRLHNLKLLS